MKKAKGKIEIKEVGESYHPPLEATASDNTDNAGRSTGTPGRKNISSLTDPSDRYAHIKNAIVPFQYSSVISNNSGYNTRDAVILCMKAYYGFSVVRSIIDTMTDFSVSDIYFQGDNEKAKTFFKAFFDKINLRSLQDKFFREYYRSGNVFMYRFDVKLKDDAVTKISQTFGANPTKEAMASLMLPARYILLNAADIQLAGGAAFVYGRFYKIMTDYEVEALRNPRTEEDKEIFNNLPPEVQKLIKERKTNVVLLELDAKKLTAVFNKKQDYEPFAVPMIYPVLDDINWKAEMKSMDMAATKTMQQVILLITMGAKPDDGGINHQNMQAMQQIFTNQSIGRVLVADYTTEAKFIIPEIADFLDPKKYEVVNADIQNGLNNILIGSEKFANTSIKIKVFIERLKKAREAFLRDFLIPEIRRLSNYLGFKNYPTPVFEDIDLRDENEYAKVVIQLMSIGVLTADEGIQAIETGRLPTPDESIESQKEFYDNRQDGLYQPLGGGPADRMQLAEQSGDQKLQQIQMKPPTGAGRPTGTKAPQSTKKVKPIGGSTISLSKIKDNMILAQGVQSVIESKLLKKFKLKKLNEEQNIVAAELLNVVLSNEEPTEWENKINDYLKNPLDKNEKRVKAVQAVALEHQVDNYLAAILYASKN